MDARLDTAFESWGMFTADGRVLPPVPGRLAYSPEAGLALELAGSLTESESQESRQMVGPRVIWGKLVGGTLVTLAECMIKYEGGGWGAVKLPTVVHPARALFGTHVASLDDLRATQYSAELSSIAGWMKTESPIENRLMSGDKSDGVDIAYRRPDPIEVKLPSRGLTLRIGQGFRVPHKLDSVAIQWFAGFTLVFDSPTTFAEISENAWQSRNLFALLTGQDISDRATTLLAALEASSLPSEPRKTTASLQLAYHQRGKHNQPDLHPTEILVPYSAIKEQFTHIVETWFGRSAQAQLATNVFFGSQLDESATIDVKFLSTCHAAESYHRSCGSGLYMEEGAYEVAIQPMLAAIPTALGDDHRQSLKNRLKYGNEFSLRKRLTSMLKLLPHDVQAAITTDPAKFVTRVVDTRNYFTHFDYASKQAALFGRDLLIATERLRVLVVATLLQDLGITDRLLEILRRKPTFAFWMAERLSL